MVATAKQAAQGEITTLLGRGAAFEGKLTFDGTVRIDGRFKGEVFSDDVLVIGEGAHVEPSCHHVAGHVVHRTPVAPGPRPEQLEGHTDGDVERGGGHALGLLEDHPSVERDLQFWIDVLVREGKIKEGQLSANKILYSSETASN